MAIIKKPYEISLWEDILTFKYSDGYTSEVADEEGHGSIIAQYYKERKMCIIGSDIMDTPIRAVAGKLVTKVNGENILTFNMYSHYYDEEADDFFVNPFIGLLVNERKIKLRYGELGAEDTKWYDLVIKNVQENSETKTFTYTAKDLFINELSKSGFNLELNAELENNMGNINTLAKVILEGSDWKLKDSGIILCQTVDEPLYEIVLNKQINAINMEEKEDTIVLNKGAKIYGFYNDIINQNGYLQFLYSDPIEVDDDYIITNSPNWYIDNVKYTNNVPDFASTMTISDKYRGKRLVRKAKTAYDSTIDKYVNVYELDDKEIYGYTETEYVSPASVRSYVTNPNSYDSYTGWDIGTKDETNQDFPSLEVVSVPDARDVSSDYDDFTSCLKIDITNSNQLLYNSGMVDHRQFIDGFTEDSEYVFRVKYGKADEMGNHGASSLAGAQVSIDFTVAEWELENGVYKFSKVYFNAKTNRSSNLNYQEIVTKCKASLSKADFDKNINNLGIFLRFESTGTYYIEDVQFFPCVRKKDNTLLLPNEIKEGEVKTKYYYYTPSKDYTSIEDITYIYQGYTPASYDEVYNDNAYEKIRSITASESNRFNLIQELSEIFECWPKFEIEHNLQTGEILLDENYRQRKWVSFHEYIGQDNYAGFKYGINLKSIQRIVDSESIVSKIIVKNNSNEFAKDGFCSIARASENPSGENFILDFSYYIQQGMLGLSELTNDLYLDINGYIGYYKQLRKLNNERDQYIEESAGLLKDLSQYQSQYQTYSLSANSAESQLKDKKIFIQSFTGITYDELMGDLDNEWWNNDQVNSAVNSISRLKTVKKNHSSLANSANENLTKAQERYDLIKRILTSRESSNEEPRLLLQKEALHNHFYKKYSRFIQEGPWISEDYIDDNLYFLDAQSTLHTSSQPKVTYNISVLELSQLEGYENFTFALGDKTTIEDVEFFGWTWKEGIKTPYKEEIVVTELSIMLDSPEQNQIKVQNYKTQFEDLFQRMAATTQALEYSTGKITKVSNIVEEDGSLKITTLQNAVANNAIILGNIKDQTVTWDETGITTSSPSDPANIVRIINGGIFLSTDGGITWNTGITGKGINASQITTGVIDVQEVRVLNGSFPSFRWDANGISAYEISLNESGAVSSYNPGKFVRFDQYGLYGINGYPNFSSIDPDTDGKIGEEKIWKHSNFALTWKGFQIKSSHAGGGYISITSDNDFEVINSNNISQVKIGLLYPGNENDNLYGIRLNDSEGNVVMQHDSDGKLWVRGELNIGSFQDAPTVKIGTLERIKGESYSTHIDFEDNEIHEVINANNKFFVYEDGSMKATDGEFTGIIHATGGTIGGLEIEQIKELGYEVVIEAEGGTVFKGTVTEKTLRATLWKGRTQITEGIQGYQWYRFGEKIEEATESTLVVSVENLDSSSDSAVYSCAITYGATN